MRHFDSQFRLCRRKPTGSKVRSSPTVRVSRHNSQASIENGFHPEKTSSFRWNLRNHVSGGALPRYTVPELRENYPCQECMSLGNKVWVLTTSYPGGLSKLEGPMMRILYHMCDFPFFWELKVTICRSLSSDLLKRQ